MNKQCHSKRCHARGRESKGGELKLMRYEALASLKSVGTGFITVASHDELIVQPLAPPHHDAPPRGSKVAAYTVPYRGATIERSRVTFHPANDLGVSVRCNNALSLRSRLVCSECSL